MSTIERNALKALASYCPLFAAEDFSCGEWIDPAPRQDGRLIFGYFSLSAPATDFYEAVYEFGWIRLDFDWSAWGTSLEGEELLNGMAGISSASAEQLSNLLTVCVRADRFVEGRLAGDFRSGLILAICRRAQELLTEG